MQKPVQHSNWLHFQFIRSQSCRLTKATTVNHRLFGETAATGVQNSNLSIYIAIVAFNRLGFDAKNKKIRLQSENCQRYFPIRSVTDRAGGSSNSVPTSGNVRTPFRQGPAAQSEGHGRKFPADWPKPHRRVRQFAAKENLRVRQRRPD